MIVFSYGIPKSGSTFAHQLICEVLSQNGHDQALFRHPILADDSTLNFTRTLDEAAFEALDAALGPGRSLAVKTHQPPADWVADWVASGRCGVFASFRDPRDTALSLVDAGRRARKHGRKAFSNIVTLEDAARELRVRIRDFAAWRRIPGAIPLGYDRVAFRTSDSLRAIAAALALPVRTLPIRARFVHGLPIGQFNKGIRQRHRREMSAEDSARFEREFEAFVAFCREQGEYASLGVPWLLRSRNFAYRTLRRFR